METEKKIKIEEIKNLEVNFSRNVWDIGKKLIDLKNMCRHGEFEDIVKNNFEFSYRYANIFMQIHNNFKTETVSTLGIRKTVELLSIEDSEEREEFIEITPVQETKVGTLKEEIKSFKLRKEIGKTGVKTDRRIIDIDFKLRDLIRSVGLLNENVKTVNYMISGFLQNAQIADYVRKDALLKMIDDYNEEIKDMRRIEI